MKIDFTFSDTIAGYVSSYHSGESWFTLRTSDDREFVVHINPNTYARYAYNLAKSYQDATGAMPTLLALARQFVFAYGTFYPGESRSFEAQRLIFPAKRRDSIVTRNRIGGSINRGRSANSYMKWQFDHPATAIDYKNYRTIPPSRGGRNSGDYLQETDTISRLVYGLSAAYMMTGRRSFPRSGREGTRVPARPHALRRPRRRRRLLVSRDKSRGRERDRSC